MARFEVGDRVRIRDNAKDRSNRGREGTVRQIVDQVEFDAALGGRYVRGEELEIVEALPQG